MIVTVIKVRELIDCNRGVRNEHRNFMLMTHHYPNLGSASG